MVNRRDIRPHLLTLLLFTTVAVAWALFILYKGGGLPTLDEKYEVSAVIPTGAALAPGSRVTVAGAHVGKVTEVERLGMGARIGLQFDDADYVPLPRDSRVQIRQHTPVGENYVSVTIGDAAQTIPSGGGLDVDQADEFVDVDRLLSVLKGDTRERARETIKGLGGALEGKGENLNEIVGETGEFLPRARDFVDVAHRERVAASRLVEQLGDVTAAIGQRDAAIRQIADRGLTALRAVGAQDEALGRTIDELPDTLRRVGRTATTLRSTSVVATPVVDEAAKALEALDPAVDRLPAATTAGRRVMRELGPAAPVLERTLDEVTKLSRPLAGALPSIRKTVCEVAPIARYIKPYMPEALHILIGLGSSSNSYDATGNLIRLAPIFSENSASGLPPDISEGLANFLYASPPTAVNYDPYPKPGELGKTRATSATPTGPSHVPATGYTYPRVEADC